ncbi:hypothetical protein Syun_014675 [Stephania yunnanensis]|uniref:1-deoxy-D-xylulose-5-phosphate reductoisomerase n=1 Tax=Stephania yunnanensis TaxID=152371 RepID=A0AAP0JLY2_9MAGN
MAMPVHLPTLESSACSPLFVIGADINNPVFRCIQGLPEGALRRIILTASGGAFRDLPFEKLKEVKVVDALKHPKLEYGENDYSGLCHPFQQAEYDDIEIDSSVLAQLGWPDMRVFGPSDVVDFLQQHLKDFSGLDVSEIANLGYGAKLQSQELTQTTPDQPVDDEAVYYKVAGDCPKGCVSEPRVVMEKEEKISRS